MFYSFIYGRVYILLFDNFIWDFPQYNNKSICICLDDRYAIVTYTYKNRQKSSVIIGDYDLSLRIAIDYADGFIFSAEDGPNCLFTDGTSVSIVYKGQYNKGVSMGDKMILQPLEERRFSTYIKCASDVESDTTSSLKVIFTTSSGSRDRYIIR